MKIISPKLDFCLKELLENEIVRRYFISDILGISVENIKTVRLKNTFLRRRHRKAKQGILDIVIELNDDAKINIEVQVKAYKYWDRRQIFYVSGLYVSDLVSGEDYSKLKKCIAISIVDFNLSDRPEYHSIYRLRDTDGNEFSDVIEIHTLELRKKLNGNGAVENWIRFFNAENEEDLDMIETGSIGLNEAIRELKKMSLLGRMRARHDAHMKYIRDRNAMLEYEYDRGMEQGIERGMEQGIKALVLDNLSEGKSREQIVAKLVKSFELSEKDAESMYNKYSSD